VDFSVNNTAIREIKLKLPAQRNLNELDVGVHLQSGRMVLRVDGSAGSVRLLNRVQIELSCLWATSCRLFAESYI